MCKRTSVLDGGGYLIWYEGVLYLNENTSLKENAIYLSTYLNA